jgi:hypothetical protein
MESHQPVFGQFGEQWVETYLQDVQLFYYKLSQPLDMGKRSFLYFVFIIMSAWAARNTVLDDSSEPSPSRCSMCVLVIY